MLCLNCQAQTNNPKFCNSSCSASFNNKGKRRHGYPPNLCLECNSLTSSVRQIYCSNTCQKSFEQKSRIIIIESNEQIYWKQIKNYLIKHKHYCHICNLQPLWNGKELRLECDHIDGDITNNCLSNARLLCPNCHSQTDTYKAKNKDNILGKSQRQKRYLKSLK